jgi:hypothetical protein
MHACVGGSSHVRAVALFLAGVLVFADVGALAALGFVATLALLFTIGFVEGRFRAATISSHGHHRAPVRLP